MELSSFSTEFDLAIFLRLVVATVLCAFVGYERERAGKAAGLRTHGMVGLGAALFTVVSILGFERGDPGRVAAQIVTGIGFIFVFLHFGPRLEHPDTDQTAPAPETGSMPRLLREAGLTDHVE